MRWLVVLTWLGLVTTRARADVDPRNCRILDLDFLPVADDHPPPQIVAWLEDPAGNFVDTVYITQATGTFGIGNRPGRFDFNSGPLWPYGRRITTFPVWSTKQPLRWPTVQFQNFNDDNLSHAVGESSRELHYCRPMQRAEFDGVTCATANVRTDKGELGNVADSHYPPREDLLFTPSVDHPSAEMLSMLNPFDTISQPTPLAGVEDVLSIALSSSIPFGSYVLWLEVSKEADTNASYNETVYPPPMVQFGEYGVPYRGQPSVLYNIPFDLSESPTTGSTLDYVGYGDPDGIDGNIRTPDATITTTVPGSGAGRLGVIAVGGSTFRVHLGSRREDDRTAPDVPRLVHTDTITSHGVAITFIAPGDDFRDGPVTGYDVRYRVGEPITEANFDTSTVVTTSLAISAPLTDQMISVDGLLPETSYSIGIRAFDNCRNTSPLVTVDVTTLDRTSGDVDACFIATAAYGSVMANDVERLRGFRDRVLSHTAFGELAIEAYYTFGPAVARFVGESELLRATAREALAPIAATVR